MSINEYNQYSQPDNKLDIIGNNVKNLRTYISELRQTIIDSFAKLENLLKDLIIGKYLKTEYGKKRNFQFKKKGIKNLQLIDDKKEISYERNNEQHYCEYNEYDKSEYNEPRNDNYLNLYIIIFFQNALKGFKSKNIE